MIPTFLRRAAALLLFVIAGPVCRAEWDGPGIDHVPICGDGAFLVGADAPAGQGVPLWVGTPHALEAAPTAEELVILHKHPPFQGLTDAQITAKVHKIRMEVWESIVLLMDHDRRLGECLESLFWNQRIFFEFSNRQVAGAVDGNSLGKLAEDCGNGAIAIKVYPCDTVADYQKDFIVMLAALSHEALHLTQTWPEGYRDLTHMNYRFWIEEMNKRHLFQCNELEASQKEKSIIFGMWLAMRGIKRNGEIPPDTATDVIPPVVRAIAQKFLNDTPAAEREAKSQEIISALTSHLDRINSVIECRKQVKNKTEEMRTRPAPQSNAQMLPLQQEWLTFIRGTGWFQYIGNEVLNGVFSLDLLAGGSGAQANQVRQYNSAGDVFTITLPELTAITDVAFLNDRSLLVGGLSITAGQGAVFSLSDTNLDNFLDTPSLIQKNSQLAGGVSLACDPLGGRGYCLGRQGGNLYTLSPPPPAIPTSLTLRDAINSRPVLDDNIFLHLPPGEGKLFFIPEFSSCITPGTQWTYMDAVSTANPPPMMVHFPLNDLIVPPVFLDLPAIGEPYVRCGGRPNVEIKLFDDALTPPSLLGTTMTDARGIGLFRLPPLTETQELRLEDPFAGDSCIFEPGPLITDPNTVLPPVAIFPPGGTSWHIQPPVFYAPPHTAYRMDVTETATWSSSPPHFATVANGDGARGIITSGMADSDPLTAPRGLWRMEWLGRVPIVPEHRIYTLPAGITSQIELRTPEFVFGAPGGASTATYQIVDDGGLNDDQVFLNPAGTVLTFTPLLTHDPSGQPDFIRIRRLGTPGEAAQDVILWLFSNRRALIEPLIAGDNASIWCLIINGLPCPAYQFTLSNNEADFCEDPHWHTPGAPSAFNLQNATTVPHPPVDCGYGLLADIPQAFVTVPLATWLAFFAAHPAGAHLTN